MKSKWVLGILMIVSLFCYGVAFAESTDTKDAAQATDTVGAVKTTAEDAIGGGESSLDSMVSEEATAPADELYAPAGESVKTETAATTEEEKKI